MAARHEVAEFAARLADVSLSFRFSVTSWWRSPSHNAAVGGGEHSLHLEGIAVDVVLDPGAIRWAFKNVVRDHGLRVLDEGDHLHISLLPVRTLPDEA